MSNRSFKLTDTIKERIQNIVGEENIRFDEPMKNHTTFKIGGPADVMAFVTNESTLSELIKYLKTDGIDYFILGNGSNLLVNDEGYRGVMVVLAGDFGEISLEGRKITAGAGAMLSAVASKATKAALTGMEFASGIPGTVGGGVIMNAGAYDGEMKTVIESVKILTKEGEIETRSNEEMRFEYRNSAVKGTGDIVLGATFLLSEGNAVEISAKCADFAARRREKQPLEYPSAGSTFKRPEGFFAGKLIEDSGLGGYTVGGAQVSTKHKGFVINTGNATAADVNGLIEHVQKTVYEKFNVRLETEVIRI